MLLSICIPSYNRGHRAYPLVKGLLECCKSDEVEIVLSNNGSDKNTEGYQKLKEIDDPRFHYYEFAQNMRYWGNYNQVIRKSEGDWCLLLSDEDDIVVDYLPYYLDMIKNNPGLGVIKAAGDDYPFEQEEYYQRGMEAVKRYFLGGNYISGAMYNRKIVTNMLVDSLAERYSTENEAYYYYPHLFVELYALLYGDFYCGNLRLISKGEGICDQEQHVSKLFTEAAYSTYESRLLQMQGFTDLIADLDESEAIRLCCFKMVIEKHAMLLCNSRIAMKRQAAQFMEKQIFNTRSPLIMQNRSDLSEYIQILIEKLL